MNIYVYLSRFGFGENVFEQEQIFPACLIIAASNAELH